MKFMISCRHSLVLLQKADEIRVDYKDRLRMADFITEEWECKQAVYLYIPKDQLIDWDFVDIYGAVLDLSIVVEDTSQIIEAKTHGYKSFWAYPATSFWELRGLLDLGVSEVLLDAPLYFDLPRVKKACGKTEIRLVVNKCMNNYMKRRSGVCGTYVRPEDVDAYGEYVDHMEFDTQDLKKEETLLRIYKQDKNFPGNLNFLLDYLNDNVDNRIIPEDFGKFRMSCKQVCQINNSCHYCPNTFSMIYELLKNKKWVLNEIANTNTEE